MSDLSHLPAGYHSVTPYLLTADVGKLLDFILEAFDAETTERVEMPDGTVFARRGADWRFAHHVGTGSRRVPPDAVDACIFTCRTVTPPTRRQSPPGRKGDEPMDQFYGDRSGGCSTRSVTSGGSVRGTRKISSEELAKRMREVGDSKRCRDRLAKRLAKWLTGRSAAAGY